MSIGMDSGEADQGRDESQSITRIYLVRHGETEWNREQRMQGHLDSTLSALGHAQAAAVANALHDLAPDYLYCSDLGRARQTAQAIAARCALTVREDSRLRERHYGQLQGLRWSEVQALHPVSAERMHGRDAQFAPDGGESLQQFHDRVVPAIEQIADLHRGSSVAIVTHGGVVGLMYRHVLSMSLEAPRDYALANASINRFRRVAGQWQIEAWGDTSHLTDFIPIDAGDGRF